MSGRALSAAEEHLLRTLSHHPRITHFFGERADERMLRAVEHECNRLAGDIIAGLEIPRAWYMGKASVTVKLDHAAQAIVLGIKDQLDPVDPNLPKGRA